MNDNAISSSSRTVIQFSDRRCDPLSKLLGYVILRPIRDHAAKLGLEGHDASTGWTEVQVILDRATSLLVEFAVEELIETRDRLGTINLGERSRHAIRLSSAHVGSDTAVPGAICIATSALPRQGHD